MKRSFSNAVALVVAVMVSGQVQAQGTPSPEGATVRIVSPENGAVVSNPVTVVFGLSAMGVAPAGTEKENTGHHHLLIDLDPGDVVMDESLPADDNLRHFGGGQTEVVLELSPGEHTLQLLLGDQNHVPHVPPVLSEQVTVTVQ